MLASKSFGFAHRFPPMRWSTQSTLEEKREMTSLIQSALIRLHQDEAGQGLIEYILIIALVAFAATAGMSNFASGVDSAFSQKRKRVGGGKKVGLRGGRIIYKKKNTTSGQGRMSKE